MTLKNACDIAESCGLDTVEEAVFNIKLHACQLFAYEKIEEELDELYTEVKNFNPSDSIYKILGRIE